MTQDFITIDCPRCRNKLKLGGKNLAYLKQFPKAWLRCPFCRERFKRPGEDFLALPPQPIRHAPFVRHRRAVAGPARGQTWGGLGREAGSSWTGESRAYRPGSEPSEAVLTLQAGTSNGWLGRRLVLFATWSLLAAVALVCLLAFRLAPLAEALGGPEPVPLAEYHEGHLVTDLVALRSSMAPSKRLMRVVDYNAPETRFYNHFVGLWGLKTCREFRSIKMWSFKPSKGFTVQAVCPKHSRDLAPKFEVAWLEGAAHVSMSGKPSSKTVPLAPPLTEVATVADAWGGDASAIGDQ